MLIAIADDSENRLLPLAFALVNKEETSTWSWFLDRVRRVVVGPNRDICVILDRHAGILSVVQNNIPRHRRLHHRWCTRHLAQNLIEHDGIKDNFDLFEEVCRQTKP